MFGHFKLLMLPLIGVVPLEIAPVHTLAAQSNEHEVLGTITVTALTARELESGALRTTFDLAPAAPKVQFQTVDSVLVFSIRGVTPIDIGDVSDVVFRKPHLVGDGRSRKPCRRSLLGPLG